MINLREIQREHLNWSKKNFPDNGIMEGALGVAEEAGELAHAILKMKQGIRGDQKDAAKDAIGDTVIYLLEVCSKLNLSLEEVIEETWKQVKQRDWTKNPKDGVTK